MVGSAVAFRLFLFFVPLVLFVVGCAGFASDLVDGEDLENVGIVGTLAVQIDGALTQSTTTRWFAVGLGLFGMATAGRTLSRVMTQASCLAWRMPLQARASVRVVGTVIGLITGIGAISVVVNAVRTHVGVGIASVSFIGAAALYSIVWLVMSARLPRPGSDPGVLLPGALVVGVTIAAMQAVSQFYLPQRFSNASELYGALGITIVTLSWFFVFGRVMVLSLTLNAVVYERYGSVSSWVFSLPVCRGAARRWPWIRRTFQLDDAAGSDPNQ